jgi:hypothetical protein|mmetsp:Transcript_11467/g.15470  ORF Transcript_11467/g.15470 Transcript_11467/m.15470 type:complete len:292 (+) Transcript_11467:49-924(+)|eukprot:CAMPEP_0185578618 /NCGR_PEP_ID=MMETSP0434-20130131/13044_1 /TAXON_ID=626734 ORGANISM="Favella taraikaensis, Strain Fe Narragansett Bay" /NCGR_SAMPLE_ID=MMETSP0434 /ASSEMBLY_ACC=CAM_ASM_000379 /LENGTH=291 /DNA_ID=CAMNT_0028196463 /DNA_START=17 /DNA_END=892 /DNA_ORIENTATION=-
MSASAFKTLYTQMIQNGGDYNALPKDLLKKDLQVFVKETKPYFLVSDSFFYVPAYFTQAAITEYQSKFPQVNVLDLENKVIVITKWSLELRRVNSTEVFTSYAGVECRLIVHSFKPQLKESLHPTRHPTNLYRDDEFKTTIQAFRHGQVVAAAASKKVEMAPITGGKGQVSQGILANSCGQWQFKEGNTKVVSLGGGKKASQGAASAVKSKGGKKVTKKVAKASGKAAAAVDSLMSGAQKTKSGKKSTGKKSTTSKPPATPDAGKRTGSTSNMTVAQYRAYLQQVKKLKKK